MKKLMLNVVAAALTIVGLGGIASMSPAYAVICPNGQENGGTFDQCGEYEQNATKGNDLFNTLNVILNVVIGVIGFIAVAMIVMGGISFATSQGDTSKVAKARNTILYGVVGLVVAILAFAIVNFVLANVFGN